MYEMTTRHLELMAMDERQLLQSRAVEMDAVNRELFAVRVGNPIGHEGED